MGMTKKDIFDQIDEQESDEMMDNLERGLASLLGKYADKERRNADDKLTSEIKEFLKAEVSKKVTPTIIQYPKEKEPADESKITNLKKQIAELKDQLEAVKRMAQNPIVMPGGTGVIGIPPPENATENHVLTVNSKKKAEWKVATGGSGGGLTAGTYSVSNPTTLRTFDANDTSLDELADIVGTLISDLGGL